MTDPLSPAARAVYDAFNRVGLYNEPSFDTDRRGLAAAFRAAATQVTPLSTNLRQNKIRYELLAIAAELEETQ
jgi:transposase